MLNGHQQGSQGNEEQGYHVYGKAVAEVAELVAFIMIRAGIDGTVGVGPSIEERGVTVRGEDDY